MTGKLQAKEEHNRQSFHNEVTLYMPLRQRSAKMLISLVVIIFGAKFQQHEMFRLSTH